MMIPLNSDGFPSRKARGQSLSTEYDDDDPRPPSNRVLVLKVDAARRPYVTTSGLFTGHRPYDWSVFGVDVCHDEMERRKAIHRLMTEDERDFFNTYCRLRDE